MSYVKIGVAGPVGSPGFDVRSIEHEQLYSRLYMS